MKVQLWSRGDFLGSRSWGAGHRVCGSAMGGEAAAPKVRGEMVQWARVPVFPLLTKYSEET